MRWLLSKEFSWAELLAGGACAALWRAGHIGVAIGLVGIAGVLVAVAQRRWPS